MRKIVVSIFMAVLIIIFSVCSKEADAGILGDINGDGRIGLEDTVITLQTVTGIRPEIQATPVIWKGTWQDGRTYKENDAVVFENICYLCIQYHTSKEGNMPPYDSVWKTLAKDGDDMGILLP